MSIVLLNLCGCERWEFSAKHLVPEPAGDTESVLVVGKMVLEVVFL